jgi:hypothetical protein
MEFMLGDADYLVEPLTHIRELVYSPQLEIGKFGCEPRYAWEASKDLSKSS